MVQGIKRTTSIWGLALLSILLLFLLLSLLRIDQTVAQEDLHRLRAAKSFSHQEAVYSDTPPLYSRCLQGMFYLFGENEAAARIPGVISGLLSILLVFFLTKTLISKNQSDGVPWAAVSALLYVTTPAVVQGSVILDVDNTLLIPSLLIVFGSLVKLQQEKKIRWAISLGLAVALALWGRITTPVVLISLLIVYVLLSKHFSGFRSFPLVAIFSGALLFGVSWYLYCRATGAVFSEPWSYTLSLLRFRTQSSGGFTVPQMLENLVYLTIWLGPLALTLFAILVSKRLTYFVKSPRVNLEDTFLLGGLVILGGYTLIGGTPFGFPKYHSPGIALMYTWLGVFLYRRNAADFPDSRLKLRNVAIFAAIAFAIQALTLGDSLYLLRYQWRESLALDAPLTEILEKTVWKGGFYFSALLVSFVTGLRFFFRKNPFSLVVAMSLGLNVGLCLLQSLAPYQTGYGYGAQGTLEAVQLIRNNVSPESVVLAPGEMIYYLNFPKSRYPILDRRWKDPEGLKKRLASEDVSAFVYSIVANTVDQVRFASSDSSFQEFLRSKFHPFTVGSFKIWIRNQ